MAVKKYSIKDFLEIKASYSPAINFGNSFVVYANNDTGTHQLYLLDLKTAVKKQITNYEDYISFSLFSPTENKIIFGKSVGGNENTQLYIYDLNTEKTESITSKSEFKYSFNGWSYDGKTILYSSNERNKVDFDIYEMELATRKVTLLYSDQGWCGALGYSPNGTYVVVSRYEANVNNHLFLVNRKTKEVTQLTAHEEDTLYGRSRWLPDESGFFLTTNLERDFMGVAFYSIEKRTFEYKFNPKWDVESLSLSRDGANLAVVVNEDGYVKLELFDPKTFKPQKHTEFPQGQFGDVSWSVDSSQLVFDFSNSSQPGNVWLYDKQTDTIKKLTESDCVVDEKIFVEPELIRFPSFDGLEISAFLYKPKGIRNPPAVINIHGGPEGQYQPYFASLTQYFVYNGYAVIARMLEAVQVMARSF